MAFLVLERALRERWLAPNVYRTPPGSRVSGIACPHEARASNTIQPHSTLARTLHAHTRMNTRPARLSLCAPSDHDHWCFQASAPPHTTPQRSTVRLYGCLQSRRTSTATHARPACHSGVNRGRARAGVVLLQGPAVSLVFSLDSEDGSRCRRFLADG